jgi:hypothetical protein
MIIDRDIILSIIFALLPLALGYALILNWLNRKYWNWLWRGIKNKCPLCLNIKEVKIHDKTNQQNISIYEHEGFLD